MNKRYSYCQLQVQVQVQVLDSSTWPQNITSPWIAGETKIRELCERFGISYVKAQDGFRDLIDNGGVEVPENLRTNDGNQQLASDLC